MQLLLLLPVLPCPLTTAPETLCMVVCTIAGKKLRDLQLYLLQRLEKWDANLDNQ